MSVAFSTRELSPRDRIPFWVDVASRAFYRHGFSAPIETFAGSLHARPLGNLYLTRCECGPCDVTRTRRDVASDDIDDIILGVRLSGHSPFSQNGRDEIIEPGMLFVQDTARPLRFNFLTQYDGGLRQHSAQRLAGPYRQRGDDDKDYCEATRCRACRRVSSPCWQHARPHSKVR